MGQTYADSYCVGHEPCPECGSRDNLARYSDGHAHCFSPGCDYYEKSEGEPGKAPKGPKGSKPKKTLKLFGEVREVRSRGLREETTQKWQYRVGPYKAVSERDAKFDGKPAHYAYYFSDDRRPIAAKVRFPGKDWTFIGDTSSVGLYGKWLWRDTGKMLVITEGEIDALSVSQTQGNKWPVVSVPNGAQGAAKAIKKDLEWIEGFERVVFMFDMDEPGQQAARECAALLSPGKAYIASLPVKDVETGEPYKDANEMLLDRKWAELTDCLWAAKEYRPDGIVSGKEITLERIKQKCAVGYDLPYPKWNEMMRGIRKGEITLLTAGTGIGKSTLARELAYHLHQTHGLTLGNVYLEEGIEKTAQGYIAIDNNVPLGALRNDPTILTDEQIQESLDRVVHTRMDFHNHFGSLESDNLLFRMRYMAVSLGADFIVLDHISLVVSGQESSSEGERKDIDRLMTKLRSLVEETGVGVIAIVHLKQPEGKPHEEGGRVTLSQLRGSGALKQISDNVIALERNQQDSQRADLTTVRVLKCREFGDTGLADTLKYHKDTGRLLEATDFDLQDEEDGAPFGDDDLPY